MGLSSLTRYNLFMESGDSIESDDGIVRFRDYLSVKNMYYDSARLIWGFEDIINNEERMPQMEEYQGIFDRNANEVQDLLFVQRITNQIQQQMSKKNGKKLLIAVAVGAVVVKAVRDVIKAKRQEEALKAAFDDFYEEELNWWDREHEEGEEL